MTFWAYFTHLRYTLEDRKITYIEISKRTGLHLTACQVEQKKAIRPKTLKLILVKGLRLKPTSPEYKRMISLWMEHYFGDKLNPDHINGAAAGKVQLDSFTQAALDLLPGVPTRLRRPLLDALERPDVLEALPSLLKVGAGK